MPPGREAVGPRGEPPPGQGRGRGVVGAMARRGKGAQGCRGRRGARPRGRGASCRRDAGAGAAGLWARRGRAGNTCRGEGRGVGGEERERERERELTSGSKSGDHCLQNLGHHGGERERWERERELCAGELNEGKEIRGGAGRQGRMGHGRAELGWAGPHHGSKSRGTHNHRSESNS
jgi:hypothetical protein